MSTKCGLFSHLSFFYVHTLAWGTFGTQKTKSAVKEHPFENKPSYLHFI